MDEKPKKSKTRISQWRFLLTWIVGQFLAYWLALVIGGLILFPAIWIFSFFGIDFDSSDVITRLIAMIVSGGLFAYLMAYVQQLSIRQRFGQHLRHWRKVSTLILTILMPIVVLGGQWAWDAFETYRQSALMETLFQVSPFVLIWGVLGIAQAWMLRKRVKHEWLFALSTVVSGILFSTVGNTSSIFAQLLTHSVTGFTLIWLFYMSSDLDTLKSEDDAISRLSDSANEIDEMPDADENTKKKYDSLWEWLWSGLRFGFDQ